MNKLRRHKQKKATLDRIGKIVQEGYFLPITMLASWLYSINTFQFKIFQFNYFFIYVVLFGIFIPKLINLILRYEVFDKLGLLFYWWFGLFPISLIFLINIYLTISENFEQSFKILSKEKSYARHTGSVEVSYDGKNKTLFLPNDKNEDIDRADSISIELNNGLLGITTIIKTTLK